MFERIGKIESTSLGIEGHGVMTFWLMLDFGGSGQGFGGWVLDSYSPEEKRRIGTAAGLDAVIQILTVCGVEKWEDIQGKIVYALYDDDKYGRAIKGIKGLSFESNKIFLIDDWQRRWQEEIKKLEKGGGNGQG